MHDFVKETCFQDKVAMPSIQLYLNHNQTKALFWLYCVLDCCSYATQTIRLIAKSLWDYDIWAKKKKKYRTLVWDLLLEIIGSLSELV